MTGSTATDNLCNSFSALTNTCGPFRARQTVGFEPSFIHHYIPHKPQRKTSISSSDSGAINSAYQDEEDSGCESSESCSSSSSVPIAKKSCLSLEDDESFVFRKVSRSELKIIESRINIENAQKEQQKSGFRKIGGRKMN